MSGGEPWWRVGVQWHGDVVVVEVHDDLDHWSAPQLARLVERLGAEAKAVALDLSGVRFADVAGFRAVLSVTRDRAHGPVMLSGVSPALVRLGELLRIELPVGDGRAGAIPLQPARPDGEMDGSPGCGAGTSSPW